MVYLWFVLLLKSCVYDPWLVCSVDGCQPFFVFKRPRFLFPWSHMSYSCLLHILTAKASCSTANPHCPLIGKLEMEENKQKIKIKKLKTKQKHEQKRQNQTRFFWDVMSLSRSRCAECHFFNYSTSLVLFLS